MRDLMNMDSCHDSYHAVMTLCRRENYRWRNERDDRRRHCVITLYKREIGGGATHWALYFDWDDYDATYEANDKKHLIPEWSRGEPSDQFEWTECKSFTRNCSPKDVNIKAKGVDINGYPYCLTRFNCHVWAQKLAKSLGIELEVAVETLLPAPVSVAVDMAYSLNSMVKDLTGYSLGGMSSRSSKK